MDLQLKKRLENSRLIPNKIINKVHKLIMLPALTLNFDT